MDKFHSTSYASTHALLGSPHIQNNGDTPVSTRNAFDREAYSVLRPLPVAWTMAALTRVPVSSWKCWKEWDKWKGSPQAGICESSGNEANLRWLVRFQQKAMKEFHGLHAVCRS
ncbi:hypothetical protein Y032_0008g73 [Ancylostoma ceylanicum]|uniref:Uncharacterized protein n=1 Tax=Ancylostoma ceylanicum TaxID=53326 RepID=A0A016VKY0_9BILA|nr:hypothetical protein Y032_0008g73 [Ancylostoma ceylanicum]